MSKTCPECGKSLENSSKFCSECGYNFSNSNRQYNTSSIFSNGKIFLLLIFIVLIIGGLFIVSTFSNDSTSSSVSNDSGDVSLSITEVSAYDNTYDSGKTTYTYYVKALFTNVPSDISGYIIRITYLDDDKNKVAQETDTLSSVYYESDYPLSFGYYTSYKILDVEYVAVEILKDNNIIVKEEANFDHNKVDFNETSIKGE